MAGVLGNSLNGVPSIIIPTMVQTSADIVDYWTSMTCLYDPNWVADPARLTLPIAFFHITSIEEICTTTVSKKRVLLYEPQPKASESSLTVAQYANTFRPSVLRTIMDNAVRDARSYSISAVVPYLPFDRYVTDGISMVSNTISSFAATLGMDTTSPGAISFSNAMSTALYYANLASNAAQALGKLPMFNGASYINKNSLDAMWENTHFLCMKMWTGFDYKYVLITGMRTTKKSNEDDVFRVSLEVTEVPVLTITRPSSFRGADTSLWSTVAKTISALPIAMMGVGTATE